MNTLVTTGILMMGLATFGAGCATTEEWQDWRGHPTHFASGHHGMFSLQNNKPAGIAA